MERDQCIRMSVTDAVSGLEERDLRHVLAVGDAVEKSDALGESPILVPLANTANLQGRRVADDIAGRGRPARGVMGTAIVGVLGLLLRGGQLRTRAAEQCRQQPP